MIEDEVDVVVRACLKRAVCAAAAAALFCAPAACRSKPEPAPPAPAQRAAVDRRTLRAVALPDLSTAEPSVQKQLREGYAQLQAAIDNPSTSDAVLGFAYGEMGKLLMAAEYRDAAEASLLNAQTLAPDEPRWP